MMENVEIFAVPGIPAIKKDHDLSAALVEAMETSCGGVRPGDILVIAQKIVSKAAGLVIRLDDVNPSSEALELAHEMGKDPRKVEVVLGESIRVVKAFRHDSEREGTIICQHHSGHISANAGVDESNVDSADALLLLPRDPDQAAANLKREIEQRTGAEIGLIISDTFGRPWRLGQVNVAIGAAGLPVFRNEIGGLDMYGREIMVTQPALADELAAASGLVVSKTSATPLVVIRGVSWSGECGQASDLIRKQKEDMFR